MPGDRRAGHGVEQQRRRALTCLGHASRDEGIPPPNTFPCIRCVPWVHDSVPVVLSFVLFGFFVVASLSWFAPEGRNAILGGFP